MGALTLRQLGVDDAAAFRALRLQNLLDHPEAFTSSYAEEAQKDIAEDRKRLMVDGAKPNDFFIGAFDGDVLVGMVGLKGAYREHERHTATVVGMMVANQCRKQGVGQLLVTALIEKVHTLPQLEQLVLTVTDGNLSAQNLYARNGFAVYGVRPSAIRVGDKRYGKVHMLLELPHP